MDKPSNTRALHALLIQAAVHKGVDGKRCFVRWQDAVSLTDIDYSTQRMLPAVSHHLDSRPLSRQVHKLVKFSRLRSQTFLEAAFRAETLLLESNIPVAWVGGAAVLVLTQASVSTRSLEDVGLLVQSGFAEEATKILKLAGFQIETHSKPPGPVISKKRSDSALIFRDLSGAPVVLHFRIFDKILKPSAEKILWARVAKRVLLGREVNTISPEDLFLQSISSRVGGNQAIWVVDAIRLLESKTIDLRTASRLSIQNKLWLRLQISLLRIARYKPDLVPMVYRYLAPPFSLLDFYLSRLVKS